jgi:hypothetical protein
MMNVPFYIIATVLVVIVGFFITYKSGIKYVEAEKGADSYVAYFLIILVALISVFWSLLSD